MLFTARSVLYDVANEAIYVTAEAEATGTQRRPTMRVNEERVIASARRGAVEELAAELETRFRALKGL